MARLPPTPVNCPPLPMTPLIVVTPAPPTVSVLMIVLTLPLIVSTLPAAAVQACGADGDGRVDRHAFIGQDAAGRHRQQAAGEHIAHRAGVYGQAVGNGRFADRDVVVRAGVEDGGSFLVHPSVGAAAGSPVVCARGPRRARPLPTGGGQGAGVIGRTGIEVSRTGEVVRYEPVSAIVAPAGAPLIFDDPVTAGGLDRRVVGAGGVVPADDGDLVIDADARLTGRVDAVGPLG